MGPVRAITTSLRKSFRFSGRASRSEFWWAAIALILTIALLLQALAFLVAFPIGFKEGFAAAREHRAFSQETVAKTFSLYAQSVFQFTQFLRLLLCVPLLAVASRRLHDTGRGALLLLSIFPALILLFAVTIAFGIAQSVDMTLLGVRVGQHLWLVLLLACAPLIWPLSRPSQPGPTPYGPNPLEASP